MKKRHQPDKVIMIGDLVDAQYASRYIKDPNGLSANLEYAESRKFINQLTDLFPKVFFTLGNHDTHIERQLKSIGLPRAVMKSWHELLGLPKGWKIDYHHTLDGIRYEHGTSMSGQGAMLKAIKDNHCCTVFGHLHSQAGVHYFRNRDHELWSMCVGCLIDEQSYAFDYGREMKARPILGCGLVTNGVPQFVPLNSVIK